MVSTKRQNVDRRRADRRDVEPENSGRLERRGLSKRNYEDRRSDQYWRFSWLRSCISQQINA